MRQALKFGGNDRFVTLSFPWSLKKGNEKAFPQKMNYFTLKIVSVNVQNFVKLQYHVQKADSLNGKSVVVTTRTFIMACLFTKIVHRLFSN